MPFMERGAAMMVRTEANEAEQIGKAGEDARRKSGFAESEAEGLTTLTSITTPSVSLPGNSSRV